MILWLIRNGGLKNASTWDPESGLDIPWMGQSGASRVLVLHDILDKDPDSVAIVSLWDDIKQVMDFLNTPGSGKQTPSLTKWCETLTQGGMGFPIGGYPDYRFFNVLEKVDYEAGGIKAALEYAPSQGAQLPARPKLATALALTEYVVWGIDLEKWKLGVLKAGGGPIGSSYMHTHVVMVPTWGLPTSIAVAVLWHSIQNLWDYEATKDETYPNWGSGGLTKEEHDAFVVDKKETCYRVRYWFDL